MEKQEKLTMHTENIADANFIALAKMFPNAVTETIDENGEVVRAIDADVLAQEINTKVVSGKEERYQFTWPDKKKSVLLANAPIAATLRPCREESVDFDNTENLYIEGDNLDVLKLLRETYLNRVKMIYIDPPYNTGNDFIYEDDFDEDTGEFLRRDGQYDEQGNRLTTNFDSNGRFHTDWLNMMYPRLRVARDLLRDDGVIFISIDENEVSNMQKICNEIFGEKNYAATFIWTKTSTPPALSYKCRKTVEYVLVYEKKINTQKYFGSLLENGDAPLLNSDNPIKTIRFPKKTVKFNFIENGTIKAGKKEKALLKNDIFVVNSVNENEFELTAQFKWGQETIFNEIALGTYFLIKTDKFSIRFQRVNSKDAYKTPTNFMNVELNTSCGVNTNESAVKELENIGLSQYFDYPKPTSLIKALCSMVCKFEKDALILDFFSGSATTAHAVMQLNAEDGGNRKFIMVQIPEPCDEKSEAYKAGYKNICEIGKERIRRAGAKIKEENKDKEGIENLDTGFRVLKLDSSNMKEVYYTPEEYSQMNFNLDGFIDNIKPDRSDEDLLFQVMLDLGIPLSAKIEQKDNIFSVNDNYLIACFDKVDTSIITQIAKKQPCYAVFRDSSFINDSALVNVEQIFNTYSPNTKRRVL
ncbi:MAG: site-specific DNA-methyltransferase [Tissierellales bacterium]|nr:site-specific DNA-methyltransferase [Tissierellales bacterium]